GGSSFHTLVNLVKRLPALLCPGWTEMPTSPVHIDKVSQSFVKAIGAPKHYGKVYDLSSTNEMSYLELLKLTGRFLGLRRQFIVLMYHRCGLSRAWVSAVSGAPRSFVYPLLNSLENEMVAAPGKKSPEDEVPRESVEEGLKKAIASSRGYDFS